jgi:hypothetical protein
MEKRFNKKCKQILLLVFLPYLFIFLMFIIPIWTFFSRLQGETTVESSPLGVVLISIFLLALIYKTYREVRRIIWIKKNYRKNPKPVLKFLQQRDEDYQRLDEMRRFSLQYRYTLKRRLYSDLLVILEKMQGKIINKN